VKPRVYLDWNASAPLRPEARAAMVAAMDVTGNPSSIHAEGRAARAVVERSRERLAEALGAGAAEIVFTSGATEAAALALAGRGLSGAAIEHEAVRAWTDDALAVDARGQVAVADPARATLQLANGETGVLQVLPRGLAVSDLTQAFGKIPLAFDWLGVDMAILSAHKLGGPRGVGALVLRRGVEVEALLRGGGQERGRRAGTENVAAIAGFAAAAAAAARELAEGVWEQVAGIREILETALASAESETILVGKDAPRLPNTLCVSSPGWKGETQVMAMDLAGFAVSAGAACSSGKARPSRVLAAMGLPEVAAAGAIRISVGPATRREEVERFAAAWHAARQRARRQAA
jgi:cysteine desulfurase